MTRNYLIKADRDHKDTRMYSLRFPVVTLLRIKAVAPNASKFIIDACDKELTRLDRLERKKKAARD